MDKNKPKPRKSNGYSDAYRLFGVPTNRRDSLAKGLVDQGSTSRNSEDLGLIYFGVPTNNRNSPAKGLVDQGSTSRNSEDLGLIYFGVPTNNRNSPAKGLVDQGSTPISTNGYSDTYRYFGVPSTSSDTSENPVQYVEAQPINWVDITDTIPANSSQQVPVSYGFAQPAPSVPVYAPANGSGQSFAEILGVPNPSELNDLLYGNKVSALNDFVAMRNNSRRYAQSMLNNSEYVPYEPPPMVVGRILDKFSRPAAVADSSPKPRISPVGLITEPVGYYK